jgi:hypothetical protein
MDNPSTRMLLTQLKDFRLTGLNRLAYCWTKSENGILADEVSALKEA